jgi:transglutaminase-like putative cysteine protease
MKHYRITHRTEYVYSGPVQLGPHALRLRPREGFDLRIESSTLTIQPHAFLRWHRDVEGNSVAIADFNTLSDHLLIESILLIQQYDQQPLDFLVEDYAVHYPFAYSVEDCVVLQPYLLGKTDQSDPALTQWLTTVWRRGEPIESYALLQRLTRAIHCLISYQRREEPGVQTPAQTLFKQTGSCRDLAFLFMDLARQLGFASRFVSGYSYTTTVSDDAGSTHAWAEVFLPGAGWKGFDPTRGEIVGENYIPVAVGRLPHFVPPVSGSLRGNAFLREMIVSVVVERLNT